MSIVWKETFFRNDLGFMLVDIEAEEFCCNSMSSESSALKVLLEEDRFKQLRLGLSL